MRRFCHCLEVCPVLAIIVISTASAVSPADWQLASSDENIFDFNAPDGQDWTLSTSDSFQGGGDTVSFNSGIIYQPPSDDISSLSNLDDNQQLFMNDNDDPQTEDFLLAGAVPNAKGEECSASDLAGKIRRRGHPLCSTGTTGFLHALPAGTVRDAGSFDLLYCPVASILIKSLFVCSSPDPLKTILVFPLYTLLESTRGKQPFCLIFFGVFGLSLIIHTRSHPFIQ